MINKKELIKKGKKILDKAVREKRELTAEEAEEFNKIDHMIKIEDFKEEMGEKKDKLKYSITELLHQFYEQTGFFVTKIDTETLISTISGEIRNTYIKDIKIEGF